MRNRKAINLKPYMPYYNISCFLLASYCSYHTIHFALTSKDYKFYCNNFDFSQPEVKQLIFVYTIIFNMIG